MKLDRVVSWIGPINNESLTRVVGKILELWDKSMNDPIHLLLNTGGGSVPAGFGFFDFIRGSGINLNTIAAGDASSMGVIVFLAGHRRFIAPHTTIGVHDNSRVYDSNTRVTAPEADMHACMSKYHAQWYEEIVARETQGKISIDDFRQMRSSCRVFSASDAIELGLAHELWQPTNPA